MRDIRAKEGGMEEVMIFGVLASFFPVVNVIVGVLTGFGLFFALTVISLGI